MFSVLAAAVAGNSAIPKAPRPLGPNASFTFGETHYEVVDGDWQAGYAANKRFTRTKGDRIPAHLRSARPLERTLR